MKKILFHSLTIPPDNVSTGMLVAEIADGFKELGVDVEILASSPQYNIEDSKNLTSDKYYTSSYKDINITHISSASRSFNKITRIFQWIMFHYLTIKFLFEILGFVFEDNKLTIDTKLLEDILTEQNIEIENDMNVSINKFVIKRNDYRKNKEFEIADYMRDRLEEVGIVIEDGNESGWRWKNS